MTKKKVRFLLHRNLLSKQKEIDVHVLILPGLLECPVCLQTCLQPISLPCSHIFCFICAKGIASHSKKCALCRKKIPDGYLNSPVIVEDPTPQIAIEGRLCKFKFIDSRFQAALHFIFRKIPMVLSRNKWMVAV